MILMAVGEHPSDYHREYADYLHQRLKSELIQDRLPAKAEWSRVWDVLQCAAIFKGMGKILPNEAELFYYTLFSLYPQFEKRLKEELENKHLA